MGDNKSHAFSPLNNLFDPSAPDVSDHMWAGGMQR